MDLPTVAAATPTCSSARRSDYRSGRPACRRRRAVSVLLLGLVLCGSVPAWAAEDLETEAAGGIPAVATRPELITAIVFSGNEVTRESILRQEMLVKEGDRAEPALIERSRQAIMDLGLFTSVHAWQEPRDDGSVLRIHVKEKFYILPVPKLNRDERDNFTIGAELTLDNLAGRNQQLKLRYENEDATGISGGQVTTYSLGYYYPRVYGSDYLWRTDFSKTHSPVEELSGATVSSLYHQEAWVAGAQVSRWLNLRGPSRGWQVGGGLVWRSNNYDYVSGALGNQFRDAQAVGATVLVQFIDEHDYLYSRSGIDYGYQGEYGAPLLGSDRQYSRHEFYFRRYLVPPGMAHQNIDMQFRLGLSSGELFNGETAAYNLGGSKTLRGYESSSFSGNAFALFTVQYLRPLFGYHPFRGVLFLDVGNAYPSNNELHLGDLQWDVGVGLRLRIKAFVNISLRLDAAYARETGEFRYFAGTKELF